MRRTRGLKRGSVQHARIESRRCPADLKASLAKAELKGKYEQQIAELRRKKQEGDQKLSAIRAAADDSWKHLKNETERTWNALKGAVEEFKTRMK